MDVLFVEEHARCLSEIGFVFDQSKQVEDTKVAPRDTLTTGSGTPSCIIFRHILRSQTRRERFARALDNFIKLMPR